MGGHVNMMDDVLISNLPATYLRSALRALISQGSGTQKPFVQHIRTRLQQSWPKFVDPRSLFPDADSVSRECLEYLALTRCIFSSKLAKEAIPYLIHFVKSVQQASASWIPGSELNVVIDRFSGDIVQSVQALKESDPDRTEELHTLLQDLLDNFSDCEQYCITSNLRYPFRRCERQVRDVLVHLYPSDKKEELSASRELLDVMLPDTSAVETVIIGPYKMPRLLNGLWQLSSPAWGSASAETQETGLAQLIRAGFITADMADHYGDAELVYGDFRNRLAVDVRSKTYAATKWCVFKPLERPVTEEWVLDAVKERCRRLGGRVELLQFHWYDYESKEYLDILAKLIGVTRSNPELVSAIGLCNFDSKHAEEVCRYLQEQIGEVGIVSNQVQFSLIDARPLKNMSTICDKYGLKLLTYGSFCGGFLSEEWLHKPIPEIYSEINPLTPSQRKYFDMINNWGTWSDFQSLLLKLSDIAKKHHVSLTNVAIRWVLQQQAVGAVIVGTRLGISNRIQENLNVFGWELDKEDLVMINESAIHKRVDSIFAHLGDCGNEYRAMN